MKGVLQCYALRTFVFNGHFAKRETDRGCRPLRRHRAARRHMDWVLMRLMRDYAILVQKRKMNSTDGGCLWIKKRRFQTFPLLKCRSLSNFCRRPKLTAELSVPAIPSVSSAGEGDLWCSSDVLCGRGWLSNATSTEFISKDRIRQPRVLLPSETMTRKLQSVSSITRVRLFTSICGRGNYPMIPYISCGTGQI